MPDLTPHTFVYMGFHRAGGSKPQQCYLDVTDADIPDEPLGMQINHDPWWDRIRRFDGSKPHARYGVGAVFEVDADDSGPSLMVQFGSARILPREKAKSLLGHASPVWPHQEDIVQWKLVHSGIIAEKKLARELDKVLSDQLDPVRKAYIEASASARPYLLAKIIAKITQG